jgi:hypothetical protein
MKKSKKRSQNTVFGAKNDISKTQSNPQKSGTKVNHKKVPFCKSLFLTFFTFFLILGFARISAENRK